MKGLFSVLVMSLVSSSVFAAEIPRNKMLNYISAINLSLKESNLNCKGGSFAYSETYEVSSELSNMYENSSSVGTVSTEGLQPLLTFASREGKRETKIEVSTTEDFKAIKSIVIYKFVEIQKEINTGNLLNPNISTVTELDLRNLITCK